MLPLPPCVGHHLKFCATHTDTQNSIAIHHAAEGGLKKANRWDAKPLAYVLGLPGYGSRVARHTQGRLGTVLCHLQLPEEVPNAFILPIVRYPSVQCVPAGLHLGAPQCTECLWRGPVAADQSRPGGASHPGLERHPESPR